jgi:hypothetical protein
MENHSNIVLPSLEDVLRERTQAPWGFAAFKLYCKKHQNLEVLLFWKEVEAWRSRADSDLTVQSADRIFQLYLLEGSDYQINLPGDLFLKLKERYERIETMSANELRSLFDEAQKEMFQLMKMGFFKHFVRDVILQNNILFAEEVARWWNDKDLTLAKFMSYPKLVNAADIRLYAFLALCLWTVVVILVCVPNQTPAIQMATKIIAVYTSCTYALRALFGPRIDAQSLFVIFWLRPFVENYLGLIKSEFRSDSLPRRYALVLGCFLGWSGTILLFVCPRTTDNDLVFKFAGLSVIGTLMVLTLLVAFCDCCLLCYAYGIIMKVQYTINEFEMRVDELTGQAGEKTQVNTEAVALTLRPSGSSNLRDSA